MNGRSDRRDALGVGSGMTSRYLPGISELTMRDAPVTRVLLTHSCKSERCAPRTRGTPLSWWMVYAERDAALRGSQRIRAHVADGSTAPGHSRPPGRGHRRRLTD